jgi:hypothetical protein
MEALTDDELLKVVTVEAHDYRQEAIDVAWAELRRRGIQAPSPQEIETIHKQTAEDRRSAPLRKLRWLKFYIFVITLDAAAVLYSLVVEFGAASAGWLIVRSSQVGLLGFLLPGMIRRTAWAYYLNWIYLALTVYSWSMRQSNMWWSLLVSFWIWAVPNFIYFRNRRQLFMPQSSRAE